MNCDLNARSMSPMANGEKFPVATSRHAAWKKLRPRCNGHPAFDVSTLSILQWAHRQTFPVVALSGYVPFAVTPLTFPVITLLVYVHLAVAPRTFSVITLCSHCNDQSRYSPWSLSIHVTVTPSRHSPWPLCVHVTVTPSRHSPWSLSVHVTVTPSRHSPWPLCVNATVIPSKHSPWSLSFHVTVTPSRHSPWPLCVHVTVTPSRHSPWSLSVHVYSDHLQDIPRDHSVPMLQWSPPDIPIDHSVSMLQWPPPDIPRDHSLPTLQLSSRGACPSKGSSPRHGEMETRPFWVTSRKIPSKWVESGRVSEAC